jgi:hypothetical protein
MSDRLFGKVKVNNHPVIKEVANGGHDGFGCDLAVSLNIGVTSKLILEILTCTSKNGK